MIKNICLHNKNNMARNICKKAMRFSNQANAFIVQPDGKILIAGSYGSYNGVVSLNRLIRLNVDGTEDKEFTLNAVLSSLIPKFSSTINAMALQSDGKILVGGSFISYNGQANKNVLIRLNPDGTEDTAFSANAVVSDTTSRFGTGQVSSIAIQADGKILVGGLFITYNGQTGKDRLIRLNADGTEDTAFSTNAVVNGTTARISASVNSIIVQPDQKILIGGAFTNYNGQTGKSFFIRLNSNGTEDTTFSTNAVVNGTANKFSTTINSVALQSDGKILVGGNFVNYNVQTGKNYLIRLNSDGTEDTAFSSNAIVNGVTARFNAQILSVVIDSNSKILVGGQYTTWSSGANKNRLMRFNSDGTEDTTFTANVLAKMNNNVQTIYVAPDASLYVGTIIGPAGYNAKINKSGAIKLNSDGTENSLLDGATAFSAGVFTLVKTPSKQLFIGGAFVDYAGQSGKSRLIKVSPSGFEDEAFNANIKNCFNNNTVLSVVTQTDGKVLVGGSFQIYNSQVGKNYLIRLNADGTEDTAFSTNAVVNSTTAQFSSLVNTIAIQTDGKILVGGAFANYRSTGKNFLIRLNSNGTEDTTFSTNAVVNGTTARFGNTVNSIVIQTDGKILVSGNFVNYNAQTGKNYLIRLNSDGTEDTAFSSNAIVNGVTARFNAQILSVVIDSNSKILVGGQYTTWSSGANKNRLMRFNSDGTEDTTFTANVLAKMNNNVQTIYVAPDASLYVGTIIGPAGYNAKINKSGAIKLNSDGTENSLLDGATAFSAGVFTLVKTPSKQLFIGGAFVDYAGQSGKSRLIKVSPSGFEDEAFNANIKNCFNNNTVLSVVTQTDGKVLVGGSFQIYNSQVGKNYLIRLNADGTEDTAFSTNAVVNSTTAQFSSLVNTIAIQTDGKILVGGAFANYRSTGKNFLIRLNSNGTEDTTFSTNAVVNGTTARFGNTVNSIVIQTDGKILVSGNFVNYNAQTGKDRLIRLNSDGTEDTAFSSNAVVNGTTARFSNVTLTAVQPDGKILVGGGFTNYNAQTGKDRLIRLNSDGTEDTSFSANAIVNGTTARFNNSVGSIAVQPDGKILVGGGFTNYNGITNKNRLIRFNSDGTEDTAFNTNITVHAINSTVLSIIVQPDNKIAIAGNFYGQSTNQYSYLNVLESNGKLYPFTYSAPKNNFLNVTGYTSQITDGDYKVATFLNSATATITGTGTADVLLVGGGGAGVKDDCTNGQGAGGGGGGVLYVNNTTLTSGSYPVLVGAGGTLLNGDCGNGNSTQGGSSTFMGFTAYSGGGVLGGASSFASNSGIGNDGSGTLVSVVNLSSTYIASNQQWNSNSQGNKGGSGLYINIQRSGNFFGRRTFAAGGGGGAGSAGQDGYPGAWLSTAAMDMGYGGNGGNGISNSITGTPVIYGGGGGASVTDGFRIDGGGNSSGPFFGTVAGIGGTGGGGNGGTSTTPPTNGTDGLGGGGGGGLYTQVNNFSGAGGSGVVIIRYKYK